MTPDRWEQIKDLLGAALDEPPERRKAFLAERCGEDLELLTQVSELLDYHDRPTERSDSANKDESDCRFSPPRIPMPATIGPYRVVRLIGEGGMGMVYLAERDVPFHQAVAIKVIKPGMDSRAVIARFAGERDALAIMDHPNIARIFDAGVTDDLRPYFVMEWVDGTPITTWCDQNQLSLAERLALFVSVCQAVQHAHHKGIIHRDIKPTNVLVTLHEGKPMVKVIDFGIAKATGKESAAETLHTDLAQVLGTPLYASPEQAGLGGQDIDARTDVYSLGVLLYELLTGTTPFEKERLQRAAYDEMQRIIREEDPPRPSTRLTTIGQQSTTIAARRASQPKRLAHEFRTELDWIVMKALEKDRARRYVTPGAFAEDVEHYLGDQPVEARPPTAVYRVGKFARRHKWGVAVAAAAAVLLAVIAVGSTIAARQQRQLAAEKEQQRVAAVLAEARADQQAREAVMNLADAYTKRGLDAVDFNGLAPLWFVKAAVTAAEDPERVHANMIRVNNWLRGQATPVAAVEAPTSERMEFEPENARYLITYSRNQAHVPARVWDLANERQLQLPQGLEPLRAAAWAPGGRLLLGSADGHVALVAMPDLKVVGRWETGGPVRCVAVSADGMLVAAATGNKLLVWTTAGATQPAIAEHSAEIVYVAFAPKGSLLVTATESDAKANVFSAENGGADSLHLRRAIPPVTHIYRGSGTRPPLFALEGQALVTVKDQGTTYIAGTIEWHDTHTGATSTSTEDNLWTLRDMTMSPDGKILAVTMGWAKFYDTTTHQITDDFGGAFCQAFDGTGQVIAYLDWQGVKVRLISAGRLGPSLVVPMIARGGNVGVALSKDARFLGASFAGCIIVYALPDDATIVHRVTLKGDKGMASWVGFSPDGAYLAPIGMLTGESEVLALQVFESATGKPAGPEMDLSGRLVSAAFSPDGRLIAGLTGVKEDPRQLRIWDWRTGAQVCPRFALDSEPVWVAYAPDGKAVAVHCIDGKVLLVDPANGRELLRVQCAERRAAGYPWMAGRGTIRFSRDGRTFFTWGSPVVEAWDRATGKVRYAVEHKADCWALAESPDGRLLATAGYDRCLQFTDTTDGKETRPPIIHPTSLTNVVFSADGRLVCTTDSAQQLRIWRVQDGTLVCALIPDSGTLSDAGFTPDGRWVVAACYGSYRLWDWQTAFPITHEIRMNGYHQALDISADGHWLAVSGANSSDRNPLVAGGVPIADLTLLTTPSTLSPDDALTWCELLSMARVTDTATVGLTAEEWLQRWRQYESRHPEVRFPVKQRALLNASD